MNASMEIVLFEDASSGVFLPLTFLKPLGMLRVGILTIEDKYRKRMVCEVLHKVSDYRSKYFVSEPSENAVWINARVLPDDAFVERIQSLNQNEALYAGNMMLASKGHPERAHSKSTWDNAVCLNGITDIFTKNGAEIVNDFKVLTFGKITQSIDASNRIIGDPSKIFVEAGAKVYASTFNTTDGPIYIGAEAEVMEGCLVRGPFALCDHAALRMGTKVYTNSTIGPNSKVGGEISNSVIQANSNKAHDGFLGNSLIGEWCNLGADTNNSNLKNNYGNVKIWSYSEEKFVNTGLTFCGLIMGDHSKCGINTMFNTGTVVGVFANIFGGGFPAKHIPSFGWGGADGFVEYDLQKALSTARIVMARRNVELTKEIVELLTDVFNLTARHRELATQSQED